MKPQPHPGAPCELTACVVGCADVPVDLARHKILLAQHPLAEIGADAWLLREGGAWMRSTSTSNYPLRFFSLDGAKAVAANLQAQTDTNFYFVMRVASMSKDDELVWPTPGIIGAVASLA